MEKTERPHLTSPILPSHPLALIRPITNSGVGARLFFHCHRGTLKIGAGYRTGSSWPEMAVATAHIYVCIYVLAPGAAVPLSSSPTALGSWGPAFFPGPFGFFLAPGAAVPLSSSLTGLGSWHWGPPFFPGPFGSWPLLILEPPLGHLVVVCVIVTMWRNVRVGLRFICRKKQKQNSECVID